MEGANVSNKKNDDFFEKCKGEDVSAEWTQRIEMSKEPLEGRISNLIQFSKYFLNLFWNFFLPN